MIKHFNAQLMVSGHDGFLLRKTSSIDIFHTTNVNVRTHEELNVNGSIMSAMEFFIFQSLEFICSPVNGSVRVHILNTIGKRKVRNDRLPMKAEVNFAVVVIATVQHIYGGKW